MHEETALDAMADMTIEKRKKRMTKKRQKSKLAGEMAKITNKVKKTEREIKDQKNRKKESAVIKRVESLRDQRIENISKKIKKSAENGISSVQVSALWSDPVEIRLLRSIQEWAFEQGFECDTSYSEIYENPRSSDDLPSDTRSFLTISWE